MTLEQRFDRIARVLKLKLKPRKLRSDVEAKINHVAFLHDVVLSLQSH